MAYATEVTISTGNKVSLNYQSQEVSVTLTYHLERTDTDVLAIVKEKTGELAEAHLTAWQTLRDAKVSARHEATEEARKETTPKDTSADSSAKPPQVQPPETAEAMAPVPRITPGQVAALLLLLTEARWSEESRHDYIRERFSCDSVEELSAEQAKEWLLDLQRAERETSQLAAQQHCFENAHRNGGHNGSHNCTP